jgi:hypothetical protein
VGRQEALGDQFPEAEMLCADAHRLGHLAQRHNRVVLAWVLDVVAFAAFAKHEIACGWHEAREIGQDPNDADDHRASVACLALGQVLGLSTGISQISLIVEVLREFGRVLRIPAKPLGAASGEGVF